MSSSNWLSYTERGGVSRTRQSLLRTIQVKAVLCAPPNHTSSLSLGNDEEEKERPLQTDTLYDMC